MASRKARFAVIAAMTVATLAAVVAPASAATDKVDGNTKAAAYVFTQTTGDCEEGSVDLVYGVINGTRMHEATVIKEAQKLGVLGTDTAAGSNWGGSDGVVKLLAHYGIKATVGSHTIQTIEADLAKGDQVIANVNAETLWATIPVNTLFGTPPAGEAWVPETPGSVADHALVLDSVDVTKSTATVSDTGAGLTYTVPLATFRTAVATSGYSYAVITTK